jgi:hypothetical protein
VIEELRAVERIDLTATPWLIAEINSVELLAHLRRIDPDASWIGSPTIAWLSSDLPRLRRRLRAESGHCAAELHAAGLKCNASTVLCNEIVLTDNVKRIYGIERGYNATGAEDGSFSSSAGFMPCRSRTANPRRAQAD